MATMHGLFSEEEYKKFHESLKVLRNLPLFLPSRRSFHDHKEYNGPSDLGSFIKYRVTNYPPVEKWQLYIKVFKFLLLSHHGYSTDYLIDWCRYMANLIPGGIDDTDVAVPTSWIGNFDGAFAYTPTESIVELEEPKVLDQVESFDPESSRFYNTMQSICHLKISMAKKVLPLIAGSVLRSKTGISVANYKNRLNKISELLDTYKSTESFSLVFPDGHHLFEILIGGSCPATHPIQQDFIAKHVLLYGQSKKNTLKRISIGLLGQSADLYGLSHYSFFESIVRRITKEETDHLINICSHLTEENELFRELISISTRFAGDKIWRCIRMVDFCFHYKYSPRAIPDLTLSLAYIAQKLCPEINNKPYDNLIKSMPRDYEKLPPYRSIVLDDMIKYWTEVLPNKN